jgi:DNA primase
MAVVVDDPLDAMAIEKVSRMSGERWGGIPLCGGAISTVQARTLYRYTATDTVIVALSGDKTWQQTAVSSLSDLSYFFRRVRAVELPDGHTPASLFQSEGGPQQLHDALMTTRPLESGFRTRRRTARLVPEASNDHPRTTVRAIGLWSEP